MKKVLIIISTAIITILLLVSGFMIWKYNADKNKYSYEAGYTAGLLYTQNSGNIVLLNNGTITERTIQEVCNMLIQNQINSQQGG